LAYSLAFPPVIVEGRRPQKLRKNLAGSEPSDEDDGMSEAACEGQAALPARQYGR
jgi:hypothetical protein